MSANVLDLLPKVNIRSVWSWVGNYDLGSPDSHYTALNNTPLIHRKLIVSVFSIRTIDGLLYLAKLREHEISEKKI